MSAALPDQWPSISWKISIASILGCLWSHNPWSPTRMWKNEKAKDVRLTILVRQAGSLLLPRAHLFQDNGKVFLTPEEVKRNMEASLRAGVDKPLFTGVAVGQFTFSPCSQKLIKYWQAPDAPVYPNVYTSSANNSGNILSSMGSKFMLPLGTTRRETEVKLKCRCVRATFLNLNTWIGMGRSYYTTGEKCPSTDYRAIH